MLRGSHSLTTTTGYGHGHDPKPCAPTDGIPNMENFLTLDS